VNEAQVQLCNTLQHTATHCNTLQHTATYCDEGYHPFEWGAGATLKHTATHCNTLQHIATHRNTPQHTVMKDIIHLNEAQVQR